MATRVSRQPAVHGPAERWFYGTMAMALLLAVYFGFARSFFLRPWYPAAVGPVPPEPFFLWHGATFAAWFVLFAVQAALVSARRIDLHRRLGSIGAVLAVLVVVAGILGAVIAARRPGGFIGIPVPPAQFLVFPLIDMVLFAACVALGIGHRRDPQSHKRLMLLATIVMVGPAIARWPPVREAGPLPLYFLINDLFLLPLVAWDLVTRGRLHPVTLWGGLLFAASHPLRILLAGTPAWAALAQAMMR